MNCFLRDVDVAGRYSISRITVWRWVRENRFPNPIQLGERCTRWRLDDVLAWEAERAGEAE